MELGRIFCRKSFTKILLTSLFVVSQIDYLQASEINELSQKSVTNSAIKNYPKILSAYEKVSAAEGSVLASKGFFDIKLKQNYSDKTRGFYDGKTYDVSLEKELGVLGAKAYGGYRKSFGDFADYEGGLRTNSGGEYRAGAKFSLLRNSGIDDNRLAVILANLGLQESKIQLENIKMEIERDATKTYWKWVVGGKIYQVYEGLYQLSLVRQNQLEQRLKKGDVAQIIVHENRKNILRRKSALAKARQDFENSAIYLSLYWRNDRGLPVTPQKNQLPNIEFYLQEIADHQAKSDLELALSNRPEIRILNVKKEEQLSELKYAKNLFKPELDVDVGSSKDLGNGPNSRSQANNYANLNFSIPLQQREAKGKFAESESRLKSIRYEQQITEEKIGAEIEQIKIRIKNIIEMHDNLVEEAKLADLLEASEREKFSHGASNFFLVNLREQDTAASKAAVFEMSEKYQEALADYKLAVFRIEKEASPSDRKTLAHE